MATPAITPTAPASAAAPVSSAPAVASTPSTPVSTSPATTTEALTPEASVAAMVAAAETAGYKDGKQPEPVKVETPAVQVDPAQQQDPAKKEEPAPDSAQQAEAPVYSLDEDGFVGAKDLAAKIDADPALKAAIPAELRNEILANARIAERLAPYEQIFASPDEAKIVVETAQEYAGFNEAFNLIATDVAKGTNSVVQKLIEAGAVRNPDGTIKKDANGKPLTNGIAGKFFEQIFMNRLNSAVVKKVEALGNDAVTAALDLVMESVGLRPSTAAKNENQDPALAAREAKLEADRKAFEQQRQQETTNQRKEYTTALEGDISSLYETERGNLLALATGLDAFAADAVKLELDKAVRSALKNNVAYQMRKDRITAQPISAERRQAEVALARQFLRENLTRIAKPILAKAGVAVTQKAAEKAANQAARADAARSEVQGGRAQGPASAGAATNPAQRLQQIEAALATKLGRTPTDSEINIEMMLASARAKNYAA